ncbi:MAG: hypothetical protein ACK5MY_07200 [Jhaorihella sp.]
MGQRISYFKNNFDEGLKDLLFDNYSKYRTWYLDFDKSSMEEFNEPFGNVTLKEYFKQDRNLQTDFENLDKNFIDELTSEFIGTYYDLTSQDNDILEFFGPMFNKWRYDESTKMVSKTNDREFIELWTYLTKGRSLKDNLYFESLTNEYKIGFLDRQEYLQFKSKIESHFGDIETIRPKNSGLEYVLSALNELREKNKEIITGIE